jgi:very-short-patch-repair endonuclease
MRSLARVLRIADTQSGVVTRRQLLAAGVSDTEIKHLIRVRALERVHPGVYVIAGSARTLVQRALSACLACGDRAAASFGTAAGLHGIGSASDDVHVTVPRELRPRSAVIHVHRTAVFGPPDIMRRGPLLLTTPARTLADLASCTPRMELTLLTDEVLRRRLIHASALLRYCDRPSIRVFAGIGVLRAIVTDRVAFGLPDSGFEALMIELLDEYELPRPLRQHRTLATGRRVRFDLAYPDHGFVIELDGWDPHSMRAQWQGDHDRDNALELAGWGRLGFTWDDVNHRRGYVALTVAERLGLRPGTWRRRTETSQVGRTRRSIG